MWNTIRNNQNEKNEEKKLKREKRNKQHFKEILLTNINRKYES